VVPTPRRVVLTGATGLVGRRLVGVLLRENWAVRALTRNPDTAHLPAAVELQRWDGSRIERDVLRDAQAVVHLAGEPVFGGLPTAERRRRMRDSRIQIAQELARGIGALPASERPGVLVCASAVGYYGDRGEQPLDESSPPGSGFLAELCVDWEAAAAEVEAHGVRRTSLRIAVVLAREGGALVPLSRLFRLGLGGRVGNGRQWFPWVHVDDVVGLFKASLERSDLRGAINAVAPEAVRNADFTRALGRALHRWTPFPVPAIALRAALGELSSELLGSRRIAPRIALERGFTFAYPTLPEALAAAL
jgi:hypothetical protein